MANIPADQNPHDIKLGDVVMLRSEEGEKMVVERIYKGDYVDHYEALCVWQKDGKHCQHSYALTSLMSLE